MSEIDRLNREVRDLNQQLQNLKAKMSSQYQTMQADMRSQMQAYERNLQQKADAQTQAVKQKYEQELARLRRDWDIRLSQEEKQMTDKYLRLLDDLEKTKEDVKKREAELEKLVEKYKAEQDKKNEQTERQAGKYLQEMKDEMEKVLKQPYEAFFPGKMNVYEGTFKNALNLMKQGLTQAAAAVAVSVRSALERFSIDVHSSQQEWEKEFQEVCAYCESLQSGLDEWKERWLQDEEDTEENISEDYITSDIDYWTRGWYLPVKTWLHERMKRNKEIKDTGIMEYLKQENAVSVETLQDEGKMLCRYLSEYISYQKMYQNLFANALERLTWGRLIEEYMKEEKGYSYSGAQYQKADVCLQKKGYFQNYNRYVLQEEENLDDYQGWYMMRFKGEGNIRVEICIIPVTNGNCLSNVIQFHIFQGENDSNSAELMASVKSAIKISVKNNNVLIYNTNDQQEKTKLCLHSLGIMVTNEVNKERKVKYL